MDTGGRLKEGICPPLVLHAPPELAVPEKKGGYFCDAVLAKVRQSSGFETLRPIFCLRGINGPRFHCHAVHSPRFSHA